MASPRKPLPADLLEKAYQEAAAAADVLRDRLLDHLRASHAQTQQVERYRRRPRPADHRAAVEVVLRDAGLQESTAVCLIRALARTDEARLAIAAADWLLEHQPHIGGTSAVLHAVLVAAATTMWDADVAHRFWQLRSSYGLPPSLESTNMVLTACSHSGRVSQALAILQGMPSEGLTPTPYSVLMVMQAANYKKQGRYKEAVQAYRCLPANAPAPSGVVDLLLAVFEAAMRNAESLDLVEDIFRDLQAVHLSDSTRAYNALMRACAARGRWQLARTYFDRMGQEEVPADTNTFNALLAACLKGGALEEALSVFEWLVSGHDVHDAIPADITTYNTLIKVCHQAGLLEKALEIATWVVCAGVPWDNTTYSELISTVEIAQLWDTKVVATPLYQQQVFNSLRPSLTDAAALDAIGDDPGGLPLPSMEQGGMAFQGHPGYTASLAASIRGTLKQEELAPASPALTQRTSGLPGTAKSSGGGASPAPRKRVPPPVQPLAIFPDQLRPAPFDSMRLMYLDHHKALQQESWLAAIKLGTHSWAARTLTHGTMPGTKPACTAGLLTAPGTDDQQAPTVSKAVPRLPKLIPPPEPVDISPAPTFRHLTLDQVTNHLHNGRVGGSPRRDTRTSHLISDDSCGPTDAPFSPSRAAAPRSTRQQSSPSVRSLHALSNMSPGSSRHMPGPSNSSLLSASMHTHTPSVGQASSAAQATAA